MQCVAPGKTTLHRIVESVLPTSDLTGYREVTYDKIAELTVVECPDGMPSAYIAYSTTDATLNVGGFLCHRIDCGYRVGEDTVDGEKGMEIGVNYALKISSSDTSVADIAYCTSRYFKDPMYTVVGLNPGNATVTHVAFGLKAEIYVTVKNGSGIS